MRGGVSPGWGVGASRDAGAGISRAAGANVGAGADVGADAGTDVAVGADVDADAGAGMGARARSSCPGPQPASYPRPLPRHLPPSCSQVFIATDACRMQPAYGWAMAALLENLDAFTTAATTAQVLPVLHGRSYLDIASMRCQEEPGRSRGGVG